jgi:L-asparaginase II
VKLPDRLSLDVEVTRGAVVESRHAVHAAVVDSTGRLVAAAGDPSLVTFWRSCAKPLQVAPLIRDGGVERFGWSDAEIAIACASHGGEPEHLAVVARMLASIGLEEGDLACGPSEPLSRRGLQLLRDAGGNPSRIHHNCSGKHAAMLARAVAAGWPTESYQAAPHPVQREAREEIARWTGVVPASIPVGIDGCGVSVFGLTLTAMARGYASFAAAAARGDEPAARIARAMQRHPFLVGGTDRFDTVLSEETGGRIIAKVGAEGVHSLAIPERGLGIALKAEDGALRAQHPAAIAALIQLGELPTPLPPRLADFLRRPIRNSRGETVGEVRAGDSTNH